MRPMSGRSANNRGVPDLAERVYRPISESQVENRLARKDRLKRVPRNRAVARVYRTSIFSTFQGDSIEKSERPKPMRL